jgi:hypothetical protein
MELPNHFDKIDLHYPGTARLAFCGGGRPNFAANSVGLR